MRRLAAAVILIAVACGEQPAVPRPSPSIAAQQAPATAAALSLDEAVGAVIMAGFQGPLTDAVLADWRQRRFGGLLVVNLNANATSGAAMSDLISRVRAAQGRRLLAATDQEGGQICVALAEVPCLAMPVDGPGSTRMAAALRAVGFDVDLGPVADVCPGPASYMWGRCYGTDPAAVSQAVGAAVDGIHAGHELAAAKHFPGHGSANGNSHEELPSVAADLATLQARDWPPFKAAVAHGVDFVMLGHLSVPALSSGGPSSLSPVTVQRLRQDVGFQGPIISDDLEMQAVTDSVPTPEAAIDFLLNGGDLVMIAHNLGVADAVFDAIKAAVLSGRLPRERLDQAVAALDALRTA